MTFIILSLIHTGIFARHRSRRFLVLLWLVLASSLSLSCQSERTTWDKIQESGVLKVGLDPTFAPFEVADDTNVWGLDVDLAEGLATNLELSTEFTYFGYDGLYDALGTKQVDVLISALVIVPERMRDFSYSSSYFNAGQVLVARDETIIEGIPDLQEHTIAVELGAQGHVLATTWQRKIPGLIINVKDSLDEALLSVAIGDVDVAIVDHVSARLFREEAPDLQIHPIEDAQEPYAIVVRSEDERLLEEINMALKRMKDTGELESIISTWLDPSS